MQTQDQESSNGPKEDESVLPLPQTVKGQGDWREYRSFKLHNGVRCTLVHDKESKMTAMAAAVEAGAAADPRCLSGLAHFCEHMCFLGSEKYPQENEYKSYLAAHGGRSNASTSAYSTTYKFEVLSSHAEKAVDIFTQFFVSPLFTSSGTAREVQAVDSENSKNLTSDLRRRYQILKAMADPEHYFSKFQTGNSTTLPTSDSTKVEWIRECLLAFHRKHYRPDNLTVVIAGPQPLDTLQEWITTRLSIMETRDFPDDVSLMTPAEILIENAAKDAPSIAYHKPAAAYNPAFKPSVQGSWPVLLTTKPLNQVRKLVLMFQLPSVARCPDRSPISVISHLLGHEGPGSPFAVLQDAGMLSSLLAGSRLAAPDHTLFHIDIKLTEKGEKHWKEVAGTIFAHCRLIHTVAEEAQGGQESELQRIWDEVVSLGSIFFHQQSPGGVYEFAPNLVGSIVLNGTEKCLSAGAKLQETADSLPLDELAEFSSLLTPSNCIIERCSPDAWTEAESMENDVTVQRMTEKWYGVDYFLSKIEPSVTKRWESDEESKAFKTIDISALHLPPENRYIPRSLELCPDLPPEARKGPRIEKEIDPPKLLLDDEKIGRLWHRLDDRYALPKSSLTILIRNPSVENVYSAGSWHFDGDSSIHSSLLTRMFNEALAQDTYAAELAGLYWSLSMKPTGILINCNGFSDRLPNLALTILGEFLKGSFLHESFFLNGKDQILRNLRSYKNSRRADTMALYFRDLLLASYESDIETSIRKAEQMTLGSSKRYHERLLQTTETTMDCFFSGNISKKEAEELFSSVSSLIQDSCKEWDTATRTPGMWIPGPVERSLIPGEDIELHFSSENPQEENGAVLATYQSTIAGFKGDGLSSATSLQSTSAIRLLCHILREPLFDELRTKQQLGYIVSSYYDMGFTTRTVGKEDPLTIPLDFITISILSRKVSPEEVASRIDAFLFEFRSSLLKMPESEIKDHADALSAKLLKPIQKLGTEVNQHFGKIRRYGPEILNRGGGGADLPWDSTVTLASAIKSLNRKDLLDVWDRVVMSKQRSRVLTYVYGSTFPRPPTTRVGFVSKFFKSNKHMVDNIADLEKLRTQLKPFEATTCTKRQATVPSLLIFMKSRIGFVGAATATVVAAGAIGFTIASRSKKSRR